jgi:predicted glycogen debranching enzyme
MINFDSKICTDFEAASSREWLETNGIGGFASGTVSGANTRRYHGLLTAATRPPLGRVTMLSKFEETLIIDGERFELSANQYQNVVYPQGFQYLKNFCRAPFPVWTFAINGIEIEKSVFMVHDENSTVAQYRIRKNSESEDLNFSENRKPIIQLELRPLISFVDYHHLQHETVGFNTDFTIFENSVQIKPDDNLPALFFAHNGISVEKSGHWYRHFEYAVEKERGFDFAEDLFQPFFLKFDLTGKTEKAIVIVSTEKRDFVDAEDLEKNEIERRDNLVKTANVETDFAEQLVLAADQFIVSRGEGKTVIAGYPWFSDWGRDTMIALNGLTLATNRAGIARQILLEFSRHISEGMLPNRFPDAGETPEYNTVDATLWYFEAVRAYVEKTGDDKFVRENLYQKLANIVEWHLRGTRYNIHVDTDGLLFAGETGTQLTWMDAKYENEVFTPRVGKPVEIQALWYNALKIMAEFAENFGDAENAKKFAATAELAKHSFNALFWNDAENCLFDVIINGQKDASVRPNQIFTVSLKNAILNDAERCRKVIEKVENELLTPFGLRSLSPNDISYRPIYTGSPFARDSAYHQGTVWVWLIGAFVDARRKVFPDGETRVTEILDGFKSHFEQAGTGQISEIFDGDTPHNPRGCPAQAWSVAEILRVLKK